MLIVDDSPVVLEILDTIFTPHCGAVVTAENVAEAKECLSEGDFHIVLADIILPDGDGFEVLTHALGLDQRPAPQVILMTATPKPGDDARALEQGATGYLTKPVSIHDVRKMLGSHRIAKTPRRSQRSRLLGKAILRDPTRDERPVVHWEVRDISRSGAFLETTAPVPGGTELDLVVILGRFRFTTKVTVVRAQSPSWASPGGVGVYFTDLSDEASAELDRFLTTAEEHGLVD
jgi:CheY-like chemotaxis protein